MYSLAQGPFRTHQFSDGSQRFPQMNTVPQVDLNDEWRVISYQIPVPIGDCSVHLLRRGSQIVNAFIMDGGKDDAQLSNSAEKAYLRIVQSLEAIDKLESNNVWQLDAWAITHWDADHYMGVEKFFLAGELKNGRKYFKAEPRLYFGEGDASNCQLQGGLLKWKNRFAHDPEDRGEKLIGRDLFTGERIFTIKGEPWRAASQQDDINRPRFCCLAANGWGVGSNKRYTTGASHNEKSIQSMLYWPKFDSNGTVPGRCSFFTAGDGNPDLAENLIIPFLENGGHMESTVKIVKLDHHGSSNEWSKFSSENGGDRVLINMALRTNAEKVIVTPGPAYGHPNWNVILCLSLFYLHRYGDGRPPDQLYSTRLPYWLTKSDLVNMDINISKERIRLANNAMKLHLKRLKLQSRLQYDHFEAWFENCDYFSSAHEQAGKIPNLKSGFHPDENEQFSERDEDVLERQDAQDDVAWLCGQFWDTISPQRTTVGQEEQPCLLQITSVKDPDQDGKIRTLNTDGEEIYYRQGPTRRSIRNFPRLNYTELDREDLAGSLYQKALDFIRTNPSKVGLLQFKQKMINLVTQEGFARGVAEDEVHGALNEARHYLRQNGTSSTRSNAGKKGRIYISKSQGIRRENGEDRSPSQSDESTLEMAIPKMYSSIRKFKTSS